MAHSKEYKGFRDLKVYQLAYKLAMKIFEETKHFPVEEKFGLISQIRRSSRSVPANIAEAWKKRIYKKAFVNKLIDSSGEAGETEVWLDMSVDSGYISEQKHKYFLNGYEEVGKMLYRMITQPEKFCP
jgi:four helix bundle protein